MRNLDALTAFHEVATIGHFGRAADSLGTSKAMVSKLIKRLESHLRVTLFHRTTRKVSLTEEGLALFTYSGQIFSLTAAAENRLQDLARAELGRIKLSAPVSLGEVLFPPILRELRELLPRVDFEVDLTNETRDFVKDGVDFALRSSEVHAPDVIAKNLGRIRDVVVVSALYGGDKKSFRPQDMRHPHDLIKEDCLLNSHRKAWNLWTFHRGDEDLSVEVKGRLATNQYPMGRVMCLNGMGIARLPHYLVHEDLQSGSLLRLLPEYEISTHPIYLVYLRSEFASKKKKITREVILRSLKKHQEFFSIPRSEAD